jgi:hypothetical protein
MRKKKREVFKNISNKLAYTLIAICVIILLGIGVYAYGTSNPANFGHTTGEITWPSCASGAYLTVSGGAVVCTTPAGGSAGIAVYRCPADPILTNYCANVQLTRNGMGPCIGQLSTSPSGCYTVDVNCAFVGISTCTLVGHLMP